MTWEGADAHADKAVFLHARAKALAAIRDWFAQEGFIEADVGALVASPGAEVHVAAFETGGSYLHTSPEFAMKRLLAAGERQIYRLGAAYRRGERGPLHAPEFTLLEWYRAGAPYEQVMDDCTAIARAVAKAIGARELRWRERRADVFSDPQIISVREAFARYTPSPTGSLRDPDSKEAGIASDPGGEGAGGGVNHNVQSISPPPYPLPSWGGGEASDAFSAALVEHVEPRLGINQLTFLNEYPISEAALAQPCAHDPSVAERFELYACGVELANGYGELTDPAEQRRRFDAAMDEKQKRYGERWPVNEDFLAALAHMPPASGCALGVDRLIMLATGARKIDDVLWSLPPQ